MTNLEIVKKFIEDNKLDFKGTSSELNGNCVILAGFICYILDVNEKTGSEGDELIAKLFLSEETRDELQRVFNFAWANSYEDFWKIPAAKEQYVF
jgi:hypothetical protein